jgi:hypothetical protein
MAFHSLAPGSVAAATALLAAGGLFAIWREQQWER